MKCKAFFCALLLANTSYSALCFSAPALSEPNLQALNKNNQNENKKVILNEENDVKTSSREITFFLRNVSLNDNTFNNSPQLIEIFNKNTNKKVSIDDLYTIVSEITLLYRNNGYPAATAYIPEQNSKDGSIRINVEKGRLGDVIVENSSHLTDRIVKLLVSDLEKGEVIKTSKLESIVGNIQGLGANAYCMLKSGNKLGESDIVFSVEKIKSNNFSIYTDNHGSKSSGKYRTTVLWNTYNLAGNGEQITVSGLLSNEKQKNYSVQYNQIIDKNGSKLGIMLSNSDYELGNVYSELGAKGNSSSIGIYGSIPLKKRLYSRIDFKYGWNYRKLKDELTAFDYIIKKHSNSFNIGIDGIEKSGKLFSNYDLSFCRGILGYDDARIGSIPLLVNNNGSYSKMFLNTAFNYSFNSNVNLLLTLQAQKAFNDLDSSEQFYLGGGNAVRAYPQGEASGDEGYQASLELNFKTKVKGLDLALFYDIGHIKYSHSNSNYGGTTLEGYGVGLRYNYNGYWAKLDYARRIGLAKNTSDQANDKGRIWFVIGKTW